MNLVLSPPLFGFVIGTRAALAFGLGLLLADRIPESRRRALGLTLVAIGAVTTIPAAMSVSRSFRRSKRRDVESSVDRDERLIGATRFPRKGDDDVV
jgi:hypothetical protein